MGVGRPGSGMEERMKDVVQVDKEGGGSSRRVEVGQKGVGSKEGQQEPAKKGNTEEGVGRGVGKEEGGR